MATKFADFLKEIEAEARAAGPQAGAQLAALDERYRLAHQLMAGRREAELTQARLSKITGVGQADISRIESGRANPTISTLAAMAHGIGYRVALVPIKKEPVAARASRGTRPRPRTAS